MEVKLEDLKVRFWTSLITIIGVGLLVLFLSSIVVKIVIAFILTVLLTTAQWELFEMANRKGLEGQALSYITAPLYIFFITFSLFFPNWKQFEPVCIGGIIALLLVEPFFVSRKPIKSVTVSLLSIFYIIVPLSFLLKICFLPTNQGVDGRWWIMFLVLVTKAGDMGAYFVGKMFGSHLLAPKVSPKKTYEGLIGGILASVAVSFAAIYCFPNARQLFSTPWLYAIFLGIALSIIGLFGDLCESLFKRDAKVKDSNKLKGFGGLLDMLDSLIFTAPAFYLFLTYGNYI